VASGSQGFIGQVVSGSGSTYMVQLNPQAVPPGDTVSVTILQIDASQTIPAGTYILPVIQVGNNYYAQVPVWLAPP
jgi:hypothetical protein